jgi:hypothetical protein
MFEREFSLLGQETHYIYRGVRSCSIMDRCGKWFFLIPGRGWGGEQCDSQVEAENKAITFLQNLRQELIGEIISEEEFDAFEKEIRVDQMRREIGI